MRKVLTATMGLGWMLLCHLEPIDVLLVDDVVMDLADAQPGKRGERGNRAEPDVRDNAPRRGERLAMDSPR